MYHSTQKTEELVRIKNQDLCTTIPPATVCTTPFKPTSSYVVRDAVGNVNLPHTQDTYQPRPSPPLKQYHSIKFQQDSAGKMLESSDVAPHPRPILSLKSAGSQTRTKEKKSQLIHLSVVVQAQSKSPKNITRDYETVFLDCKDRVNHSCLWNHGRHPFTGGDAT
jgi:hypothetical protein